MTLFQAIVIAIVEGLTEFLPISSTAHMIFTSAAFGVEKDEFVKMFQVSIQFGAILAVVALYWKKFFNLRRLDFYLKLGLAVIPALVLGYFFDDAIEGVLEKPLPIAVTLVIGGIVLLFIDRIFKRQSAAPVTSSDKTPDGTVPEIPGNRLIEDESAISIPKAVAIGVWQCLAMMPGVSRAAASIIGGMQQRLTRSAAAEFSFFLAVPTMLAVTAYSIFLKDWKVSSGEQKGYELLTSSSENMVAFAVGNVVAFIVAALAIRFFIGFLKKYGFRIWGWYRIVAGLLMIVLFR
jgi:undecaprenyl-diphosphatase